MDYEKKYKEALEWARKVIQGKVGFVLDEVLEKFPELKESEDERIIRAIDEAIKDAHINTLEEYGSSCKEARTWLKAQLEKQNKQNHANSTKTCEDEQKTVEWHREDEQNLNTCLSYIPDEYLRRWLVDVVHVKYDKPADKVEPKFKAGDKIIGIVSGIQYYITEVCNDHYFTETGCCIMFNAQNNFKLYKQKPVDSYCQENCKGFKETGKGFTDEDYKAKREAESINKVEPKFHEKDWVVNKEGRIFQIMRIDNDFNHITYACRFIEQDTKDWVSYSEDDISLWDISNAKNGDVLASNCSIFIFSQEYMVGKPEAHCGIMNGFFIAKPEGCWTNEKCYPATKEQRYFLFGKMREAGYEWDADRKELRKIKSKFHKGEWVTNGIETVQITGYDIDYGYQVDYKDNLQHRDTDIIEKEYHLWTIEDAKDGDALVDKDNNIGIYKEIEGIYWDSYVYLGCDGKLRGFSIGGMHDQPQTHPATREQRDNLLKAMAEAGWDFDFEKKELKKIKPIDEYEGLTDFERAVADACIGFIDKDLVGWKQYVKDNADNLLKIAVKKFHAVQDDSIQINPSEYINDMGGNGCYLKNTTQVSAWSEGDAEMVEGLNNCLDELEEKNGWKYVYVNDKNVELTKVRNWLKLLKERVACEANCTTTKEWKPSEEQVKVLEFFISYVTKCSIVLQKSKDTLLSLLADLKKLKEE